MKRHECSNNLLKTVALCLGALLAANCCIAQMTTPLHITAPGPILNEFGNVLKGRSGASADQRDLVQVLWATNSIIHPPDVLGNPHPDNPPLENGTAYIGRLTAPDLVNPGAFALSLKYPRPTAGTIFVRVYNASTVDDASFYADSQPMTINGNNVLVAKIDATVHPIDPNDDDGDGLSNSWEKSLGTDSLQHDSDADGMTDFEEYLAGTDGTNDGSLLLMCDIMPYGSDDALIAWASTPGKSYYVQYTDDPNADLHSYYSITDAILATEDFTQIVIENGLANANGKYRVKLAD